jgi:hypothetical protein
MEKASKNGVEVLLSFSFTYLVTNKEMASRLNKKNVNLPGTYAITHKLKI